jgi:hypothetical protein
LTAYIVATPEEADELYRRKAGYMEEVHPDAWALEQQTVEPEAVPGAIPESSEQKEEDSKQEAAGSGQKAEDKIN